MDADGFSSSFSTAQEDPELDGLDVLEWVSPQHSLKESTAPEAKAGGPCGQFLPPPGLDCFGPEPVLSDGEELADLLDDLPLALGSTVKRIPSYRSSGTDSFSTDKFGDSHETTCLKQALSRTSTTVTGRRDSFGRRDSWGRRTSGGGLKDVPSRRTSASRPEGEEDEWFVRRHSAGSTRMSGLSSQPQLRGSASAASKPEGDEDEWFARRHSGGSTRISGWSSQQPQPQPQSQINGAFKQFQPGDSVFVNFGGSTPQIPRGIGVTIKRWDEATGQWEVTLPDDETLMVQPRVLSYVPGEVAKPANADGYQGGLNQPADRTAWAPRVEKGSIPLRAQRVMKVELRDAPGRGERSPAMPLTQMTTVMMRNIPNDYTSRMLLELLDREGFKTSYRFVYLPIDLARSAGFGYAFIDLKSHEDANRFHARFNGFCDWDIQTQKVCRVGWSDVLQGTEAHIERFRNSPVMHSTVPDYAKPMIFENGVKLPFPGPTRTVRAPRARKELRAQDGATEAP